MNTKNLIPLNKRTKEEARSIQSSGGSANTEKQKLQRMLAPIKHGRYARKFSLMVKDLAKDPELSAIKIFDIVERVSDDWSILNPQLKMQLGRLYCEAHRTIHGTKTTNLNLNANEEIEGLKEFLLKKKEKENDNR